MLKGIVKSFQVVMAAMITTNNIAALKVINIDKIDWYFYLHKTTLKVTAVLEKMFVMFLTGPIIFTLFSNAIILWELSVVYHAIWLNIDTSSFRWIGDKKKFLFCFLKKVIYYWYKFSLLATVFHSLIKGFIMNN